MYNDTLNKHFHFCGYWPTSTWKTAGYEALKSNGVEIIEAKQLRESVIDLYKAEYPELSEIIRNSEGYSYSTLVPEFTGLGKSSAAAVGQPLEEITAKPFSYEIVVRLEAERVYNLFLKKRLYLPYTCTMHYGCTNLN